jgi:septum formation protein
MLRKLSGRAHEVVTGVSLRTRKVEVGTVARTAVRFAALSDLQIAEYVASGEGSDKAGAYAIQGLASRFIPSIEGSYSNVVGLPVADVAELLSRLASGGKSSYSQLDSSRKSL